MSEIKYVVDVPGYPPSHSPYSHAVVANGFVFVSGQAAVRPGGGALEIVGTTMQEQTRQALRNVESVLKAAGSSLDKVVKVTVLLARPDLFKDNERGLRRVLPEEQAGPSRSTAWGRDSGPANLDRGRRRTVRPWHTYVPYQSRTPRPPTRDAIVAEDSQLLLTSVDGTKPTSLRLGGMSAFEGKPDTTRIGCHVGS